MADTSLIFNIIARDSGVGRALDAISRGFRGAGRDAEEALGKATSETEHLDRQIDEARTRVRSLAQEFARTGDKRLFGAISRDRTLISNLERVRAALRDTGSESRNTDTATSGLSGTLLRAGSAAAGFGGSLMSAGGSLMSSVSSIWGMVAAAAALSAGLFAAGGAIGVFGGAAAALPGMLSGAIAAIATLKLGLFGLSENWEAMNAPPTGGGGGGGAGRQPVDMTPKIRAVEAAQRGVARSARDIRDAQEALREATDNVNRARAEEKERIEDVRRSLASARADEEESVQSLAEARMQLALAETRGNPDEIRRAQIAVDKQAASLAEARDKTQDLQQESDRAARVGVEGSDAVVDAKKRERDAQRRVQDAVEAHRLAIQQLGDAQRSLNEKIAAAGAAAGGGIGKVVPKIAKSAQEFLNVLKELKPAFDDLRLAVQEHLFAGLADKMRTLAAIWIPQLKVSLVNMADTINGIVKTAFDSLSRPSFVRNMAASFEGFRHALHDVGQAVAGPLVDAFGRLARASVPFMEMLGEKIAGVITHFSDWIAEMDDSGKLDAFMAKATDITGHVLDIMEDLARIAGSVIGILFGTNLGSTDAWENLADGVDRVANWMGDPDNQAKISDFLNRLGGAVFMVMGIVKDADSWIERIKGWGGKLEGAYNAVSGFFTNLPETIGTFFTGVGNRIQAFPGQVGRFLASLPGIVGRAAMAAIQQLGYWIGYGIGWAVRTMATLPSRIWGVLRSLPAIAAASVANMAGWFRQLGPRVFNAARNVGSWLYSALRNLPSMMWSIGYNAVIGIWRGMQSLAGWLWNAAYNFASSIWRGMMSALGIHSPSKVMADRVGRWIPLGIAAGIDSTASAVHDAAGRIADGLASTTMSVGGLDTGALDQAMASATGTVQVSAARRRPQQVVVKLDVTGTDSEMKRLIQKLGRTSNLYQTA